MVINDTVQGILPAILIL